MYQIFTQNVPCSKSEHQLYRFHDTAMLITEFCFTKNYQSLRQDFLKFFFINND